MGLEDNDIVLCRNIEKDVEFYSQKCQKNMKSERNLS